MTVWRTCRVCGCTNEDCTGCLQRTGKPCYWVAPDLCSACRNATPTKVGQSPPAQLDSRPTPPICSPATIRQRIDLFD